MSTFSIPHKLENKKEKEKENNQKRRKKKSNDGVNKANLMTNVLSSPKAFAVQLQLHT